jgi:hypothetical protein
MFTITEVISTRALKDDEAFVNVVVLSINPKKASVILTKLASLLPLEAHNLDHLKRVRKQRNKEGESNIEFVDEDSGEKVTYPFRLQVLLCPTQAFRAAANNASIRGLLGLSADAVVEEEDTALQSSQGRLQSIKVCRVSPETRSEFDEWNALWPTTFRADHLTRERSKGPVHSALEEEQIREYMRMVKEDSKACKEVVAAAAAVAPAAAAMKGASAPIQNSTHVSVLLAKEEAEEAGVGFDGAMSDPTLLCGGIVVNPATGLVIARSADYYATLHRRRPGSSTMSSGSSGSSSSSAALYNPLNTPTMRCIEMVAAVVRGEMLFPPPSSGTGAGTGAGAGAGAGAGTGKQFISNESEALASKVGGVHRENRLNATRVAPSAQKSSTLSASYEAPVRSQDDDADDADDDEEEQEDAYSRFVDDQYLCTDLDLYLQLEPDTMAAMALVHSRIRRVYFLQTHGDGAISTRLHLHVMRQLNHRYRAFHCVEREQEREQEQ